MKRLVEIGLLLGAAASPCALVGLGLFPGTGPFMLAEFYRREAVVSSRTILLSTLGSLLTLSIVLFLAAHNRLG